MQDTGGAAGDVALRTRVGNVGCGRLFDAAQIDDDGTRPVAAL